eukprot:SAG31_NODE_997_length_10464_cov_16.740473_5_plen_1320_part_00
MSSPRLQTVQARHADDERVRVADMIERVEIMEDQMLAEKELRVNLETNLKDQQEAMDALMDMLEKTLTVDENRESLQELQDTLGSQLRDNQEEVERLNKRVAVVDESLGEAAHSVVESVDDVRHELKQRANGLDQEVQKLSDTMHDKLATMTEKLESKMAIMDEKREHEHTTLTQKITAVEKAVITRVDDVHRNCLAKVDGVSSALDSKSSSLTKTMKETTASLRSMMEQHLQTNAAKLKGSADSLHAEFQRANDALREKLSAEHDVLTAAMNRLEKKTETRYTELRTRTNSEVQQARELSSEGLAKTNARVDEELQDMRARLLKGITDRDAALTRMDSKLVESCEVLQARFNQQLVVLDEKLANLNKSSNSGIRALNTQIETYIQDSEQAFRAEGEDRKVAQAAIQQVDMKLEDAISNLTLDLSRVREQNTAVCNGMESIFSAKMQDADAKVTQQLQALSDRCQQAEIGTTQRAYETDARLEQLTNDIEANHAYATSEVEALGRKALDLTSPLVQNLHILEMDVRSGRDDLRSEIQQKDEAVNKRIDDQEQKFLSNCANDKNFLMNEVRDVQNEFRAHQRNSQAEDTRIFNELDRKIDVASGTLKRELDVIQTGLIATQQEVSAHTAEFDRVDATLSSLQTQISNNQAGNKAELDRLDTACTEIQDSLKLETGKLNDSLARATKDFAQEQDKLDVKFGRKASEQDIRMDELEKCGQDVNSQLTTMCGDLQTTATSNREHFDGLFADIESRFRGRCDSLDERAETDREYFNGLCETLQNTISAADTESRASVQTLSVESRKLVNELEMRLTTSLDDQEKRLDLIDGVNGTIEQTKKLVNDLCGSLNDQMMAQHEANEKRMDNLDKAVSEEQRTRGEADKTLENRLLKDNAAHEDRMDRQEAVSSEKYTKINLKLDKADEDHSERCEALETDLQKQSESVLGRCQDLEDKFSKEIKEQTLGVHSLSDTCKENFQQLLEVSQKLEDTLGQQLTRADARIDSVMRDLSQTTERHKTLHQDLAKSTTEQLRNHDQSMKIQHEQFSKILGDLASKISEEVEAVDVRVEAAKQHCLDVCAETNDTMSKKDAAQQAKIHDLKIEVGNQSHKTDVAIEGLSKQISSVDVGQSKKTDALLKYVDESCMKLDSQLTAVQEDISAKHKQMVETVHSNHSQSADDIAKLDQNMTVIETALSAASQERFDQLSTRCNEIVQTFNAKNLQQDNLIVDAGNTLNKHHQHFEDAFGTLDAKNLAKFKVQEERIDNVFKHFSEAIADLDKRFRDGEQDATLDRLSSAVQEHYDTFMDMHKAADDRLKESESSVSNL